MSLLPAFDDRPELAARLAPKLQALAGRSLYFGTSSWKYDEWIGSIYRAERYLIRGKHSAAKFERECLAEYAETFPSVCADLSFYQFPSPNYWDGLFGATPKEFTFAVKVTEDITVPVWPNHARYGRKAGLPNEHFLDARAFAQFFVKPLERYKERLGPVIFEFGTFNKSTFATPADFMSRLGPFVEALPDGIRYTIELRNPEYLSPAYFALLQEPRRGPRVQCMDADARVRRTGAT
jgi:uncharacterized protein YecE (DUF72 family)